MNRTWLIVCLGLLFVPVAALGQRVELTAGDGHPLVGTLTRPQEKDLHAGVVLLPMYRHTRESWDPLVTVLARAGFTTLALDLRGHGESRIDAQGNDDGQRVLARDPSLFNAMDMDAVAAVNWLVRDESIAEDRIGLVGASVGCSVAIKAVAEKRTRVGAVVVMTPGSGYLGVDTMAHIRSWPEIPLLILSSEEEKERGAVPVFTRLRRRGAALRLFPQTGIHGTRMFGRVPDVEILIRDWLISHMARP